MNPVKAYITYVEPNETNDGTTLKECKEVIFCEDCKWYDPVLAECNMTSSVVTPNGYCAWASPREDADESDSEAE